MLIFILYLRNWDRILDIMYLFYFKRFTLYWSKASLTSQTIKNLPAMQETWVGSTTDWKDPLEQEKTAH